MEEKFNQYKLTPSSWLTHKAIKLTRLRNSKSEMNKNLLIGVILINLALISMLLFKIKSIDGDKGIALLYFYYPVLVGINLFLGLLFQFINPKNARVFFISAGGLLLAILPIVFIVSTFE